ATGQRPMGTGRLAHGQCQKGNAQQPPFPQLRPLWAVSVDDVSQHRLPSIPGGQGIPPPAPWYGAEGGFIPAFEKVLMCPAAFSPRLNPAGEVLLRIYPAAVFGDLVVEVGAGGDA